MRVLLLACAAALALLAAMPAAQAMDPFRTYAFCEHPSGDGPIPQALELSPVPVAYSGPGGVRCGANVKETQHNCARYGLDIGLAKATACALDSPVETGAGLWASLPSMPGDVCLGGSGVDCWGVNVGYWSETRGDCVAQVESPSTNDVILCHQPRDYAAWCLDSGIANLCTK